MDEPGAAGTASTAGASVSKPRTATEVGTVLSDATSAAGVQTLNGGSVVRNCHALGGHPKSAHNTVSSGKGVPTVTLARAPMQTAGTPVAPPAATVASAGASTDNKCVSVQVPVQAGNAQFVVSSVATGTAATTRSPTVIQNLRTSVLSAVAATPTGTRAIAPQVLAPRITQPQQNVQNIQLPPGMVLVRSETGQLLMIHQQTLAQMQVQLQSQSAMTSRPAAPTNTPPVQITSLQGSTIQTTVSPTTTLHRPPVLQNTIMLGGSTTITGQPQATPATVQAGSAATAVTQRETVENVKKCRNFLSTLIKLASSGKQSSETTANVKELVKKLLEGKLEPEGFTSSLYRELNSSPQPYLVPFLNRSLPALRQMTPDSEAFIQQSLLPQPSTHPAAAASAALTAVVLRPPLSTTTAATSTSSAPQQMGMIVRPQITLPQSSMVTVRGQAHNHTIVGQPQLVKQLQPVSALKQSLVTGAKAISQSSLTTAQKIQLKEAGEGTFRDDDDINDVASMAGVNLSEESARILATGSELVGRVTRSCKDETFLSTPLLTRKALEIGRKFGVSELGKEVINYISHATQQRLRNLLEKASQVAQQKNITFKEDERYEQVSDVRTQLRFFEQLDQMEKHRKEEQEREILLKAAKSRSRQEDPEQLRLKQKAKEMQQQELAQIRQREANQTALAAIGPRKKRRMDSPVRGASAEGSGSGPSHPGASAGSGSRQFMRQRITRVNLRDLLSCLENEKGTSHSHLLYKGFLK